MAEDGLPSFIKKSTREEVLCVGFIQIALRAWNTSCTFARRENACSRVLIKNRGLFKQHGSDGTKHAEVLKVMMESGYVPDKPIKTKKVKSKNSPYIYLCCH